MLEPEQLASLRYKMNSPPDIGGNPGDYEEKWTQWFLEQSFFREFVYRNPERKKGKELADAVVLYDDVLLMTQVKAQNSTRNPLDWAKKNLPAAVRQLMGTRRMLADGHVPKLVNEIYGEVHFDTRDYPHQIGIIVLAQDGPRFIAEYLAPEIRAASFPIHVFSLSDFREVVRRFDTAADLIIFLEFRRDIGKVLQYFVHDEPGNIKRMLPYIQQVLKSYDPSTPQDILEKSSASFRRKAMGELLQSPDWRYSLAIDDMIAHSHDLDPNLPWNQAKKQSSGQVATFLGWLSRDRRIKLGKRIVAACEAAQDGNNHYFHHYKPSLGKVIVFLATSVDRAERVQQIRFLLEVAQVKCSAPIGLGVATEPIGQGGRSYDFVIAKEHPPQALAHELQKHVSLFGEHVAL